MKAELANLAEALKNRAPRSLRRHFPVKVNSLEDFIAILEREASTHVDAVVDIRVKDGANSWSVGMIGNFEYATQLWSQTTSDRPIIFDELHATRHGSEYGFSDARERVEHNLRTFVTANDRLETIRARLPYVTSDILRGNERLTPEQQTRVLKDAARYQIIPFNTEPQK